MVNSESQIWTWVLWHRPVITAEGETEAGGLQIESQTEL